MASRSRRLRGWIAQAPLSSEAIRKEKETGKRKGKIQKKGTRKMINQLAAGAARLLVFNFRCFMMNLAKKRLWPWPRIARALLVK